jgi:hypothetical protein
VAAVGVGKVYGPYEGRKWSIQVVGKNAEIVIEKLWPWLSGPKRRQIERAREKFANRPEEGLRNGRDCPPGCTCGRHTGWWSTHSKEEAKSTEHRRAQQREYTRRYRERKKLAAPDE